MRAYHLADLLAKKCITSKYFPEIKQDIEKTLSFEEFSTFRSQLKDIGFYLEEAEDCAYIRGCEIDLRNFMKNLVIKYQEELKNGHGEKRSIRSIIETFFDSSNIDAFVKSQRRLKNTILRGL